MYRLLGDSCSSIGENCAATMKQCGVTWAVNADPLGTLRWRRNTKVVQFDAYVQYRCCDNTTLLASWQDA